ncbi:hypothetical protein EW145_g3019 [Phellinidium pouzarii]|uniref:AB hydrolase-1 domain-containing protein n=1 Tax=Phellinidium pouzarii TaxID=167371 RepID=A0A4S4LAA5_9AGAM|nr:hypothetical protein EW145_g3019 [Phellinidium pouzarii]
MQGATDTVQKFVISADGTRIYADAVGSSSNPALVFAHGFTASSVAYNGLFSNPDYSKNFYLIRYDVRGHGRTGKPNDAEGYLSHKYAEDFAAVLKAFDAKKPIFIGWSMGATIIADIIAHLPSDTLIGAVCLAGAPCNGPIIQAANSETFMNLGFFSVSTVEAAYRADVVVTRLVLIRNRNPDADFVEKTIKANETGDDFRDDNPYVSWETRCAILGMAGHIFPTQRRLVVTRKQDPTKLFELGAKGFPLLAVYGTEDGLVSGDKIVEGIQPHFTNLQVKNVEGASHSPFLDDPDEVMEAIFGFAKKIMST